MPCRVGTDEHRAVRSHGEADIRNAILADDRAAGSGECGKAGDGNTEAFPQLIEVRFDQHRMCLQPFEQKRTARVEHNGNAGFRCGERERLIKVRGNAGRNAAAQDKKACA